MIAAFMPIFPEMGRTGDNFVICPAGPPRAGISALAASFQLRAWFTRLRTGEPKKIPKREFLEE